MSVDIHVSLVNAPLRDIYISDFCPLDMICVSKSFLLQVVVPLSFAQKPLKALGKKTAAASSRQPTLSTKGGASSSSLTIRKELEHNGKESSDYDSDSESDSNSVISDI